MTDDTKTHNNERPDDGRVRESTLNSGDDEIPPLPALIDIISDNQATSSDGGDASPTTESTVVTHHLVPPSFDSGDRQSNMIRISEEAHFALPAGGDESRATDSTVVMHHLVPSSFDSGDRPNRLPTWV
uniref:Uncharacterized protein n=1 Tax=Grammatophora oceanica TaxID=210454 RepID=A0A7S1VSN3_9STRA|mmetsp:Transcript_53542/g.79939  ORF Transcript_53542/g.79939 Transcript_53542/m.79939 type:complete len:129 (+) Transcript_53542:157-543(+)|eukprot:CAMPEP_0194063060 /NCGR_PEP_ID=MMETSP0009_2-20130614/79346_1 /TAXON_ID=210454 /ORGANISM="Grammatophora oceanica, Strain CCMP 410" /LENGTH=128 /DNA_ID=CAMNT_0038715041 /DNA_START=113 /DNA_END=499 /DNA_ORIENTATION=-